MKYNYIFLTTEGYTYQPDSLNNEPDIENMQVIGFASGESAEEAFKSLISENKYLIETSFNEVICYKLDNEYEKTRQVSLLKEHV